MTVFHFDDRNSVTNTSEKHNCPIEELQLLLTGYRQWKSKSRLSVSSDSDALSAEDSDDSEKADDIWDEEILGDPQHGTGLLHDHCYTKRKAEKRVPSVSSECSSKADESLQHLFDTCDIDRDFLAEATLAHDHFLEDVLDIGDVPADDFIFFDFNETSTGCSVPTSVSSNRLSIAPCLPSASPPPCIFTSAGSTDTVLSTNVAGLTSYNTHRPLSSSPSPVMSCCVSAVSRSASEKSPCVQVPLFDFSVSSSLSTSSSPSSTTASFSSSSDIPAPVLSSFTADLVSNNSLSSNSSSLDSKLKDVIDFLFSSTTAPGSIMTSPNVTSFLEEMDGVRSTAAAKHNTRQPPLSFSDSEDSVWPVTLSHRIQDGACVSCCLKRQPTATSSNRDESVMAVGGSAFSSNNDSDSGLAPPVSDLAAKRLHLLQEQQQLDTDSSSATSILRSRSGKRKSRDVEGEDCSLYPPVCSKQARLGEASSDEDCEADKDEAFSPPALPPIPLPVEFHLPAVLDAENAECGDKVSEKVEGLRKRSREVFDFLSAFSGSNTKLPLSPINVNHFGRCG